MGALFFGVRGVYVFPHTLMELPLGPIAARFLAIRRMTAIILQTFAKETTSL
jgi:hypothetical protein